MSQRARLDEEEMRCIMLPHKMQDEFAHINKELFMRVVMPVTKTKQIGLFCVSTPIQAAPEENDADGGEEEMTTAETTAYVLGE